MTTFIVKTSNGITGKINANNATEAQARTLYLLKNEGDYLELTSAKVNILRTTKEADSNHWNHKGFKFSSYDYKEGVNLGISLFK